MRWGGYITQARLSRSSSMQAAHILPVVVRFSWDTCGYCRRNVLQRAAITMKPPPRVQPSRSKCLDRLFEYFMRASMMRTRPDPSLQQSLYSDYRKDPLPLCVLLRSIDSARSIASTNSVVLTIAPRSRPSRLSSARRSRCAATRSPISRISLRARSPSVSSMRTCSNVNGSKYSRGLSRDDLSPVLALVALAS